MKAHELLSGLGLPGRDALRSATDSPHRFPDGAHYRVEIPSVEGPRVLAAVIEEARQRAVPIHRVSQGSGIMLLTDDEIGEMCGMCREAAWSCRCSWARAPRGTRARSCRRRGTLGAQLRGQDQVRYALDDVIRASSWRPQRAGGRHGAAADPRPCQAGPPAGRPDHQDQRAARGGQSPAESPSPTRARRRSTCRPISRWPISRPSGHCDIPLDVYVEVPDGFGGFVRHYEIPALEGRPVYVKFGLRNAPDIYPSGLHLEAMRSRSEGSASGAPIGLALLGRSWRPRLSAGRDAPGRPVHPGCPRRHVTEIETFLVGTEWRNFTICRVHTDTGLTGLGESRIPNHPHALGVRPGGGAAHRRA